MLGVGDIVPLLTTAVTFPSFHPLAGDSGPVFAFLIKHPSGAILVDTGVGRGSDFVDRYYQPVHHSLVDGLHAEGVAVHEVVVVVNSHLHFDHAGQNSLFPNASIHVQRAEWALMDAGSHTIDDWVRFPGASYEVVDGETEIATGIRVVPTPGHTAGHQAVIVDTAEGRVVLAGQVPYNVAEFDHVMANNALPRRNDASDADAYLRSIQRLVDLDPTIVFFSHCNTQWWNPRR